MNKTAILVDGGFYRRRAQFLFGDETAEKSAMRLEKYCFSHIKKQKIQSLYRIFYYDCPPMGEKIYHPFLKKEIDFSKTDLYSWMNIFLECLRRKRKFAVRLGELGSNFAHYNLREKQTKYLCNGRKAFSDLTEHDFEIKVMQKGVDMRIGMDIASMVFKHQVDQIILISGDSDFIPIVKMARREGIDFILDPLGAHVHRTLLEHVDGIQTLVSQKKKRKS